LKIFKIFCLGGGGGGSEIFKIFRVPTRAAIFFLEKIGSDDYIFL
jgi:hypothetical protein